MTGDIDGWQGQIFGGQRNSPTTSIQADTIHGFDNEPSAIADLLESLTDESCVINHNAYKITGAPDIYSVKFA